MRIAFIATVAACLVAVAPIFAQSKTAADGQLVGSVGPGFTISVKDSNGTNVTHLDPGTYTLLVHDLSAEHNFHLSGPGVNVLTDVLDAGDQTFTINVTDGVYNFNCDAHPTLMKGAFAVGSATLPPTTTTTTTSTNPAPRPPRPITLRVGPGRSIAAPSKLTAGRYAITVQDSTAADDLHLQGPTVNKKTGVAFKGKVKWNVTLRHGTYRAFSDAHKTLAKKITVN
jgi:plastocyanin